ncbi:sigma-70 family RNA polymerase sigma factor [Mucilaginibacter robiniae]|uniref:Sigma-70 family RNA polymerase sigma factor n=1 Tax=Mucilaginibacter robiniae TaxID=2728022 RepID=A0A7L5DVW2_9SPHI|nr:sigma-70 family RNA polymerase sigma factor [Mucilaginibacter robiniae]QJD95230.1 sigma-70 family RNA polymerase sigma factor [Mucilaginibacter robiniae]
MSQPVTLDRVEVIFKENYTPLLSYVNSIVKDQEQSKDVISDLFLHLWQQKDQLQINHIKPYLFRAARNGALKMVTLSNRSLQLSEDTFNVPADIYNPLEKIVVKQSIKIVESLINQLSPLRKEMIELRLLGLKNQEIARVLDITEKKVEYNMREAIEQLGHAIHHSRLDKATVAGGLMVLNLLFTIM